MALGFEFSETMKGTYHRVESPGDEMPMSLTVRVQVHDVAKFLLDPTAEITGEVDAPGFAEHRALRGTLEITPIVRRKLVYEFRFPSNEEQDCRFHGQIELLPSRPIEAITTLPGSIYVDDREVARAILRFHVRDELLRLIKSFRTR